ncbi:hypothetical protein B0H13DRAFT_1675932 [Mycena leptocephala]|nr:hypothetical protein B0H13DRAFT_1675932 [Mycena leptocephala]
MKKITPKDWDGWPTQDQLLELSEKANGLFHYAATALQWIKQQVDKEGKACQGWVFLQLTEEGGLGQLEQLYKLILTSFEPISEVPLSAQARQRHEDRLSSFRHVIGTILVLYEPLTIRQIIALLGDIPIQKLDVPRCLQQLRSVLMPGMTASFDEATPQMHKSFRDYIMNAAPPEFRIHTGDAHFVTARSCLEVIVKAGNQSDMELEYSVRHWHRHLRQAVEECATFWNERMWILFGWMVEEAVVKIWAESSWDVFVEVATAGWGC